MSKKIKIAVLMGGKSSEHEVSIISGTEVVKNLDERKYEVLPVVISKNGTTWKLTNKDSLLSLEDTLRLRDTSNEIALIESKTISGVGAISDKPIDLIFIAMHGQFGEDGTVQGMLELAGILYTGSKVLASAIGMDKEVFRKLMQSQKLPIPKYITLHKGSKNSNFRKILGKMPYFVKPVNGGSSVGASIAENAIEFKRAVNLAFKYDDRILIDEYLKGVEVTCGVIGNENPTPLPVVEIRPLKGKFFDYESKYTESGSEEIVPARISRSLTKKIQDLSLRVFKTVGCRGFARIDFILKDNKYPIILEVNTIPGLTPMSLLPKAAKAAGISYSTLLNRIIKYALN
jgi:D-alanine-D-alanine ligase